VYKEADEILFNKILFNSAHILQPLLPDHSASIYNLRTRSHDKLLIDNTLCLNERDFLVHM